jgi:dTDP-4-amino-4,6-dideoxygalactose transaminase
MATQVPFLDLKIQYQQIQSEVNRAIQTVIDSCAFVNGPATKQFEKHFAAYCGAKFAVGVANGTDALHLALRALGIGNGDEVITAANTFIATAEAITLAGARVVFADIHPETYNIDVTKIEEKISSKTKAIIAVHLFGQPADMTPILALAQKYHLKIIEDACQAHGAKYQGQRVGTFGDVACFSFYPGKNLGAYGDGGAVVTNDETIARKVAMLADHGSLVKYQHEVEGTNSRLDSIQAAILDVKLNYLDQWNRRRWQNARCYNELLKDVAGIITPRELPETEPVYHLYVIQAEDRDRLRQHLTEAGIGTGIHYPIALHLQPAYQHLGLKIGDYPVAEQCTRRYLSLPMYPELTESMIETVCQAIKKYVA